MKKGNKKSSIIDRAKSNVEKNRKEQKVENFFKKFKKYINTFNGRFILLFLLTVAGFTMLLGRVYHLQTKGGKKYREDAEKKYSSEYYVKPKRGKISTSDGQVLAYDNEQFVVILDPTLIDEENIGTVLDMLKRYIDPFETDKYRADYAEKKRQSKQYLKIDGKISYQTRMAIEAEIDNDRKEARKNKGKYKRRFRGVTFETAFTRNYVQNDAFQETLGYVNNENRGVYGIEKYYDKELSGERGVVKGLRIPEAFLRLVKLNNKENSRKVKDGNNIVLTIDSFIQYALDEELRTTFEKYNADSSMGVVMEVETGKIVAMSSYPKATEKANIKNRTITDFFEPGSIFKPVTVAMGLETKAINPNVRIYSPGFIKVQDRIIKDHDGKAMGNLSLMDAIAYSSNVIMVKIGLMINRDVFHHYLTDVGLGAKTGVDTYSESTKKLLKLRELTEVKQANISFGQGISMTQLQILVALNTVVNNGKLMKPYLVDRIEDSNGKIVEQNKPVVIKKVFSDEVSRLNRRYMEAVVNYGTGNGAYIPGYRVGGKTGTAQKSGVGGYIKGKYFSSFFAFFPVENPKYALIITINEPKGKIYGAQVALPSVRNIIAKLIEYKRIGPDGKPKKEEETDKKAEFVQQEKKKDLGKIKQDFDKNIMPDLTGISLREFLSIYPQGKFAQYEITGSGVVVSQFPEKGTKLDKQTKIQIMLE